MEKVELELIWYCPACKKENDPEINICCKCGEEFEIQTPSNWKKGEKDG